MKRYSWVLLSLLLPKTLSSSASGSDKSTNGGAGLLFNHAKQNMQELNPPSNTTMDIEPLGHPCQNNDL